MKRRSTSKGRLRFSAKLLFQFRVGTSSIMRLCEERIILLAANSGRGALALAKKRGRAAEHKYKNNEGATVHFEFVGVLDLLHLGVECEPGEVWYNLTQRKLPKERASQILPPEASLNAIRTLGR